MNEISDPLAAHRFARPEPVFIGPMLVGKSTVSGMLGEALGIERVSSDARRWEIFEEVGYSHDDARAAFDAGGFPGLCRYWEPYVIEVVERLLATESDCVFDFGAPHSALERPELRQRFLSAVEPHPVVLMLPVPDPDESVRFLTEKFGENLDHGVDMHRFYVEHPVNRQAANAVVYVANKTLEMVRDEILGLMGRL